MQNVGSCLFASLRFPSLFGWRSKGRAAFLYSRCVYLLSSSVPLSFLSFLFRSVSCRSACPSHLLAVSAVCPFLITMYQARSSSTSWPLYYSLYCFCTACSLYCTALCIALCAGPYAALLSVPPPLLHTLRLVCGYHGMILGTHVVLIPVLILVLILGTHT